MTTQAYLAEHAMAARLTLELAQKEAEHLHYSQSFLDSLMLANTAAQMLFDVIDKIRAELERLGIQTR